MLSYPITKEEIEYLREFRGKKVEVNKALVRLELHIPKRRYDFTYCYSGCCGTLVDVNNFVIKLDTWDIPFFSDKKSQRKREEMHSYEIIILINSEDEHFSSLRWKPDLLSGFGNVDPERLLKEKKKVILYHRALKEVCYGACRKLELIRALLPEDMRLRLKEYELGEHTDKKYMNQKIKKTIYRIEERYGYTALSLEGDEVVFEDFSDHHPDEDAFYAVGTFPITKYKEGIQKLIKKGHCLIKGADLSEYGSKGYETLRLRKVPDDEADGPEIEVSYHGMYWDTTIYFHCDVDKLVLK